MNGGILQGETRAQQSCLEQQQDKILNKTFVNKKGRSEKKNNGAMFMAVDNNCSVVAPDPGSDPDSKKSGSYHFRSTTLNNLKASTTGTVPRY